jgi:type IV pilus assembly protein PilA
MSRRSRSQAGFTLIELMIVVAIIGILAAIAIPNFMRFQLRARSSEGKSNLAAIRGAELGYFAEYNAFVPAAVTPAALPLGRTPWPAPAPGCPNCFDSLGFTPEGDVLFQYEVVAAVAGGSTAGPDVFTAAAAADLDGDGVAQIWGYVRPLEDQSGAVPSTLTGGAVTTPCLATGTWDAVAGAAQQLESVGPCDASSGQSVF